ncbi:MAG: PD40 domain-containing protein [Acidobacteria bacterium]|nr:PD40 domain-containing protein [Acidobacteriota bacterium]
MPSPNISARHATLALLAGLFAIPPGSTQSGPLGLAYQFTHSDNSDLTISPDGKQLVVLSVIAGREQLVRMNIDRSNPVQITTDAADHEDPAWSPDGKKIAFVLIRDGREQIHLMSPDGTGIEPLAPADRKTIHPAWSSDSQSVLYCTDDDLHPPAKNDAEIYLINIASKKTTRLIAGGVNTYPSLSPDGSKIAFRRMVENTNSEIFVANSDGSAAVNITNSPAFDGWPAWSPKGTKIAFATNRGGNHEIYIMSPDGTGVRKVASTEGRATAPKWSPDGTAIYFPNCWKSAYSYDCQVFAVKLDPAY